jgi:hypothetical protein
MQITTNNQWRDFKYGYELTRKQLDDIIDFHDWSREYAMSYYGYVTAYGMVFSLDEFVKIDYQDDEELSSWHGIYPLTFLSGVVIQVSPDGEQYKVGFLSG